MAGSTESTGDSAFNPWIHGSERRHSPIPYRTGPLEYEPAVNCHCGSKAALWISWSDDNPGRRYFKCYRARDNGCDFMGWYEGPHHPFVQSLLVDLRNAVWRLRRQNAALNAAIGDAAMKVQEEKKDVSEWKVEVAAARAEMRRMGTERKVLRAMVVGVFAAMVYLWAGQ